MLTAVTPPTEFQLTCVQNAVPFLGLSSQDAAPTVLPLLVSAASRACAAYIGRPLGRGQWTETFVDSGRQLCLSRLPVNDIVSFTMGGDAVDPASYSFNPASGVVVCRGVLDGYGDGWRPVTSITYDAGYVLFDDADADVTLPEDIQQACLEVVKAMFFTSGTNIRDPAVRSESVEGVGATSYLDPQSASGGLPMLAASLLAPYRSMGC